jgi:hypothetical protein
MFAHSARQARPRLRARPAAALDAAEISARQRLFHGVEKGPALGAAQRPIAAGFPEDRKAIEAIAKRASA